MKNTKITNYYIPGSHSRLHYLDDDVEESKDDEPSKVNNTEVSDHLSLVGFHDAALLNLEYINLLDRLGVNEMSNQELKMSLGISSTRIQEKWIDFDPYQILLSDVQKQAIFEFYYLGRTQDQILKSQNITKEDFKLSIQSYKKWLKIRSNYNKRFLNKKARLNSSHVDFIKSLVWT